MILGEVSCIMIEFRLISELEYSSMVWKLSNKGHDIFWLVRYLLASAMVCLLCYLIHSSTGC